MKYEANENKESRKRNLHMGLEKILQGRK